MSCTVRYQSTARNNNNRERAVREAGDLFIGSHSWQFWAAALIGFDGGPHPQSLPDPCRGRREAQQTLLPPSPLRPAPHPIFPTRSAASFLFWAASAPPPVLGDPVLPMACPQALEVGNGCAHRPLAEPVLSRSAGPLGQNQCCRCGVDRQQAEALKTCPPPGVSAVPLASRSASSLAPICSPCLYQPAPGVSIYWLSCASLCHI
jgi:hypothetical protein